MHHQHDSALPWFMQWNWDSIVLISLLLLSGLYLYGVITLRKKHQLAERVEGKELTLFFLGIAITFFSLVSPLNYLTTHLFAAHMIQHMLISFAASPLLLLGIPVWLSRFLLRKQPLLLIWKGLTIPIIASLLFNGNMWIWHAPPILNAMMQSHALHLLVQFLYLFTGFLFWWPLIAPEIEGISTPNMAGKMIYTLQSDMPMMLLGAGLTFMPPLYDVFIKAPRIWEITPAMDQQLGGAIMWVPGGVFLFTVASLIFLRWMMRLEAGLEQENAHPEESLEAEEDEELDELQPAPRARSTQA